ncbi:serine/threonine-protein kinase [Enhygromyxa salina]|uniref:Serine/threonine-protein kinase PknA n=1 Tax=Enhygromyxa salina TaxID=215803 RepID=A0A2S9YKI3_9BACT|nr:serine/threonine-protein kinase [Enhygromyxa salina]PRQ05552.1 Serine/threonine-protein kinase PknA [Enhygromyxa salina]
MDSEELRWTEPNEKEPDSGTLVGGQISPGEADFEPGAKLGRYVVLAHMGAGGMGVVYGAYDPHLDRRIALKLMHQRGDDPAQAERASQRMLAEAKAMAQLNHPNVISVHDVGTIDGRVFIAMEFVEGVPLSKWMREPGRTWQELLGAFTKAGRGLEAAHAAGLVHRDFKPDNVLVGADGRVRVLDFGLARRIDGSRDPSERREREAGTPAYMSPEQHLGKPLDHRADQFSFCVALYEALYGEMPFAAKTRLELALAVTDGRVGPAPKRASVPNWLRWALLRGLDPDPDGRWENMAQLLAELGRDPSHRLRTIVQWSVASVALVALMVTGVMIANGQRIEPADPASRCTSGADEIAKVWNDERVDAVRAAFAKVDAPWARELGPEVEAKLGAWAHDWAAMHRESCEATDNGSQSAWMLDRRVLCLNRKRAEFDELVEVISTKAETLARAREAVIELPPLSSCEAAAIELDGAGLEAGLEGAAPSANVEQQVVLQLLDRDLYRAHSLEMTGGFEEALRLAMGCVEKARELEDQTRLATALLTQAQIVMATGGHDAVTPLLEEAEFAAERAGADRLRGSILIALARVDAKARDGRAASRHVREARAVLDRVQASATEYAELDGVAALASVAHGQPEQAEQQVRAAIASISGITDAGSLPPIELAQLHATLGAILRDLGRYSEARSALEQAQQLWIGRYGEQHPKVAAVRVELATLDDRQGRHADAVAGYEAALAVLEQVFGSNSLDVGYASAALAVSLGELGRYDESLRQHQRARAIFRAHGDPAMVSLAKTLDAEGVVQLRREQFEEALKLHQQALKILERARGGRGFDLADLAPTQVHLAEALLALERPEDARPQLDGALELMLSLQATPSIEREREQLAAVRLLAARAWASGTAANLERARELADAARADFVALQRADSVAEIDTWLGSL